MKKIKKELAQLLGDEELVEWAFRQETRNVVLAGMIDGALVGREWQKANELLKELGEDEFEKSFRVQTGKTVNTVGDARRWHKHVAKIVGR